MSETTTTTSEGVKAGPLGWLAVRVRCHLEAAGRLERHALLRRVEHGTGERVLAGQLEVALQALLAAGDIVAFPGDEFAVRVRGAKEVATLEVLADAEAPGTLRLDDISEGLRRKGLLPGNGNLLDLLGRLERMGYVEVLRPGPMRSTWAWRLGDGVAAALWPRDSERETTRETTTDSATLEAAILEQLHRPASASLLSFYLAHGRPALNPTADELFDALERLVRRGLIEEVEMGEGEDIEYRRAPVRAPDYIARIVIEEKGSGPGYEVRLYDRFGNVLSETEVGDYCEEVRDRGMSLVEAVSWAQRAAVADAS